MSTELKINLSQTVSVITADRSSAKSHFLAVVMKNQSCVLFVHLDLEEGFQFVEYHTEHTSTVQVSLTVRGPQNGGFSLQSLHISTRFK